MMRVGIGTDVHPFAPGRRLVLGGVEIPHDKGLDGHSDADVLSHAVADALLGALADGDLGRHFPADDVRWKDVSSLDLLARVVRRVRAAGWSVVNVDTVVLAQTPRLADHLEAIRACLAACLGVDPGCVGIKATTTDRLGFLGRGEGVGAQAVVLLERPPQPG